MRPLILPLYEPGAFEPLMAGNWDGPFRGIPVRLGLLRDGKATGVLTADVLEDTVIIRWVGVDAPDLRTGVGSALLDTLFEAVKEAGAVRAETSICLPEESSLRAEAFFRSQGFSPDYLCPAYQFPLSAFLEGTLNSKMKNPDHHAVPLSSLTPRQLRVFNQNLAQTEPSGAPFPISPEEFLPESMVWLEEGKVTGCLLLEPCDEMIELRWLYGRGLPALTGQLTAGAKALAHSYGPEVIIHALALSPGVEELIQRTVSGNVISSDPVVHLQREL